MEISNQNPLRSESFIIERHDSEFSEEILRNYENLRDKLVQELNSLSYKDRNFVIKHLNSMTAGISGAIGGTMSAIALNVIFVYNDEDCQNIASGFIKDMLITVGLSAAGGYVAGCGLYALYKGVQYWKKTGQLLGLIKTTSVFVNALWNGSIGGFWKVASMTGMTATGIGVFFTYLRCKNIHLISLKQYKANEWQKTKNLFYTKAETDKCSLRKHIYKNLSEEDAKKLNEKLDVKFYANFTSKYMIFPMIQDKGLAYHELKRKAESAESEAEKYRFNEEASNLLSEFGENNVDCSHYDKLHLLERYNDKDVNPKLLDKSSLGILEPRKIEAYLYDWNLAWESYQALLDTNIAPKFAQDVADFHHYVMKHDPLARKYIQIIKVNKNGIERVILDNPPQRNMKPHVIRLDDPNDLLDKKVV